MIEVLDFNCRFVCEKSKLFTEYGVRTRTTFTVFCPSPNHYNYLRLFSRHDCTANVSVSRALQCEYESNPHRHASDLCASGFVHSLSQCAKMEKEDFNASDYYYWLYNFMKQKTQLLSMCWSTAIQTISNKLCLLLQQREWIVRNTLISAPNSNHSVLVAIIVFSFWYRSLVSRANRIHNYRHI